MISHSCARAARAAAFSSVALLATALAASAHVTLANAATAQNSTYKAVLQVPHGRDGVAATAIRVQTPEDVIGVKPMTVAQASSAPHDHAGADTFKVGAITVAAPWTRATPGGAKVAGGYLKLTNAGPSADRLIGGISDIAGRLELHEMAMNNGVMQMRPLNGGIDIKPGETVELKPGGLHVMFMDLKRQLKQGETAKVTLEFEKAGKVEVTFKVDSIGGTSAPHKHH
jgi:copper(I)-binding protein